VKKLISVVTGCFNEEQNVEEVHRQVRAVFERLPDYRYEHIFIDNASTDDTVRVLKSVAAEDPRVKIIVNSRNFGHVRSGYHGMMEAGGDAVIFLVADLQDPPELILEFVRRWEEGYKMVLGVKKASGESTLMFRLRKLYYRLINRLSAIPLVESFAGYGLFDRQVMEILKGFDEPYPYFRGMLSEVGFEQYQVEYVQPERERGKSKSSFLTLFDFAMLGFTNHSKIPLRLATLLGFGCATVSLAVAIIYFGYKLLYWDQFELGQAPVVVGIFFFASVQLFFLGIVGEYVGSIHTYVQKRPLVIERERINFDAEEPD
jgi:polyisoprenyl-phosphate glycosyltransferase